MRLVCFVRLYQRLNEHRQDRLDQMNIAPNFFQITLEALFSALILWIDKLFGSKSERGFINFLVFIEKNLKILRFPSFRDVELIPMGIGC